jgi:hypothetical protein
VSFLQQQTHFVLAFVDERHSYKPQAFMALVEEVSLSLGLAH